MQKVIDRGPQSFKVRVNGREVVFDEQLVPARTILDRAGYEGTFCLAATRGESGKIIQQFGEGDLVDVHDHKHFRATFCGEEVVS